MYMRKRSKNWVISIRVFFLRFNSKQEKRGAVSKICLILTLTELSFLYFTKRPLLQTFIVIKADNRYDVRHTFES